MHMKITPLDIHHKQFTVKFRGFDKEEVESLLKLVRDEMENLLRKNATLREEVTKAEKQIKDYKDTESGLRSILIGAQQMVEEYKNNVQKEVEIIKKDAELKAQNIIGNAQQKFIKLQGDIADLQRVRRHFKEEVKQLIENHLKMFDWHGEPEKEHSVNSKMNNNGDDRILLEFKNSQLIKIK